MDANVESNIHFQQIFKLISIQGKTTMIHNTWNDATCVINSLDTSTSTITSNACFVFFFSYKKPNFVHIIINSSTQERHVTTHQSSGQFPNKKYNPVIIYINSKCKRGLMKYINNILSLFLLYCLLCVLDTNDKNFIDQYLKML